MFIHINIHATQHQYIKKAFLREFACKYEKYYGHQNKLGFTQADAKMRAFVNVTCKREIIWKVGQKGAGRKGSGMGEGRILGNIAQLKSLSWTSGAWMCDYISRNNIKLVIDCGLTPHC